MYAIEEGMKLINGEVVDTFEREITEGKTTIQVEAGTTGYRGGGRQSGSRCFFRVKCLGGDFHFSTLSEGEGIEIACCGDDSLSALMKALEFSCQAMNDQICEVDD